MPAILAVLAVPVVAALLWRLQASWPHPLLASAAGLVALVGIAASFLAVSHRPSGAPRHLAALALLAAVLTALGFSDRLWPCPVACSGGAFFAQLWGLPLIAWATGAYGLLAVLAGVQANRQVLLPVVEYLGWACVGVSLYYLLQALRLELLCSHCLAIHSVVLCFPAVLLPGGRLHWSGRLATMALAALALHAAYHPQLRELSTTATVVDAPEQVIDAGQIRFLLAADHGRRFGDRAAPRRLELYLDPHCPHCREAWPTFERTVADDLAAGRVELSIHFVDPVGVSDEGFLSKLMLVTAAHQRLARELPSLLGMPSGLDAASERQRLAEHQQRFAADVDLFDPVLGLLAAADRERARLRDIRGPLPQLLLFEAGRAEALEHWRQDLPSAEIDAALAP